ncbi:hypothetical protein MGYG_06765 [Nannizzia gypsea CBS 118893]|uniref:Rhodopsin domain-containing protein n=1 Tax=Arthroderma gypseum (strain ATCC MYA-4604 / CBS 118893) TaxID=535722 RepID=E4V151_ARTGP|nr:hypothetical protein MGYG_06765 [Nannizzia gypsea CBS 118893]EFR03766.1 hypothetical protein MGYG_06765 [Nannizzia gypsea CBS 118893]
MPLLPYQSPPLLALDSTHRGSLVVIAGAIAGAVTLTGLLIRLYIHLAINPHYGRDDYFLLGAAVVAFCQSILVFVSVSKGYGTSADLINLKDLVVLRRAFFSSEILYLVTLYLAKCCVICIFLKLTPKKTHNRATLGALVYCTLWVIGSIMTVGINSGVLDRTTLRAVSVSYCKLKLNKWRGIVSFDVLSEIIIFILAVHLIQELQMRFRTKAVVLSAFAARLPLIALAIIRLHYLNKCGAQTNLTLDLVDSSVWTQISLNYSVIACTIFALKPFTAAVSTNYGTAGDQSLQNSKNNSHGSTVDNTCSRDLESGTYTSRSKEHNFSRPHTSNSTHHSQKKQRPRRKSQLSTSLSRSIANKEAKSQPSLPRFSLFSPSSPTRHHQRLKSSDERHEMASINSHIPPVPTLPQNQTSKNTHTRTASRGVRVPFLHKGEKRGTGSMDSHGSLSGVGSIHGPGPVASDTIIDPPAAAATTITTAITAGGGDRMEANSEADWNDDNTKLIIKKDIEYTVQYGD